MMSFVVFVLWLFEFLSLIAMTSFNMGSFNINGCQGTEKRAALFDYLQLKKIDIVLLQETHSNVQNQMHGSWVILTVL